MRVEGASTSRRSSLLLPSNDRGEIDWHGVDQFAEESSSGTGGVGEASISRPGDLSGLTSGMVNEPEVRLVSDASPGHAFVGQSKIC